MERRKHGTIKAETLTYVPSEPIGMRPWLNDERSRNGTYSSPATTGRERSIANANPLPIEGQQYDRQEFHCYREPESDGRSRPPSAHQRGGGHQQQ